MPIVPIIRTIMNIIGLPRLVIPSITFFMFLLDPRFPL
uniref:Uncharacterized protein n=1 Tax=Anguilla anguilla TaxID=7936 RepID=A0A0E9PC68_ANGAN